MICTGSICEKKRSLMLFYEPHGAIYMYSDCSICMPNHPSSIHLSRELPIPDDANRTQQQLYVYIELVWIF